MRNTSGLIKLFSLAALATVFLSACGGGASTETNSGGGGGGATGVQTTEFLGPEVIAYRDTVYEELKSQSRCGQCHSSTGNNRAPLFADPDIGTAYDAATSILNNGQVSDLDTPSNSLLVTHIQSGHQPQACLGATSAACAIEIENLIIAWNAASEGLGVVEKGVELVAPQIRFAEDSKTFPTGTSGFAALHTNYLVEYCADCHKPNAASPQSPFFASDDINQAYLAAQQKIDLANPQNSRFVLKLRNQFHNCWTTNCTADADAMQAAIQTYANGIDSTAIDSSLVISAALKLEPPEAIIAAGGERHVSNQIALWEFKNPGGDVNDTPVTALDSSGVTPKINLSFSGDVKWVGGYGVQFNSTGFDGRAQATTEASEKILNNLRLRGEYSIEAWLVPANVAQQNRNIITYSADANARNFTIAQNEYHYQFYNRSTTGLTGTGVTGENGGPVLESADEDLQSSQQHIVMTYDKVNGRRMYVNGVWTEDEEASDKIDPTGDTLSQWDKTHAIVLGNENGVFTDTKAWRGTMRMVAIHNRVLTDEQITQNFKAGVGEKFFLLFSISHIDGVPDDSYIKVQAEQFDTYSYLFNNPVYVNLGNPVPTDIDFPIKGMRVGINGKEAIVGQAFINLTEDGTDLDVTANNQEISRLGSIIELQRGPTGPTADDFFLSFEVLGNESNPFEVTNAVASTDPLPDLDVQPDVAVRTFSEINGAMSDLTGVPVDNSAVQSKYKLLRQQLPSIEGVNAFGTANIIGISQLAFEYCEQLVENTEGNRDAYFNHATLGNFNFSTNVETAFNIGDGNDTNTSDNAGSRTTTSTTSDRQKQIVDILYDKMLGLQGVAATDISNAPTRAEIMSELVDPTNVAVGEPYGSPVVAGNAGNLFDRLLRSCGIDDPDTNQVLCSDNVNGKGTKEFVKAMCTSVLGSAAMLVQ